MKRSDTIANKIFSLAALKKQLAAWRLSGKKVAFTNGCFDILHAGHISSLQQAAATADYLIVAINSDVSIQNLKGPSRPINQQQSRALLMASLVMVDAVVVFDEPTPLQLIEELLPDVLVKGGDYTIENIVGADTVIKNGGKVVINHLVEGYSTTNIIHKIRQSI